MTGYQNSIISCRTRRNFIKTAAASMALALLPEVGCAVREKKKTGKMILSFYLDDTNPEIVKATAYRDFVEYCYSNGIKGESTLLLGYSGTSLNDHPDENQRLYLDLVRESYPKGMDTHMEIMTHDELFDFDRKIKKEEGIHEGLWLHEPGVTAEEYYHYFSGIISEGEKSGIKFTGLTWPGCGCEACSLRYEELRKEGPLHLNEGVFQALLKLAREGKFRNRVVPIFYDVNEKEGGIFRRAADGPYGVYELMPNVGDYFGIWENTTDKVDPDYYINEDGTSGMILRHLEAGAPYGMWYMHWQGLNPENGAGWEAFKTVTGRIQKHLKDQVVWMRPGDMVSAYHDTGDWSFVNR